MQKKINKSFLLYILLIALSLRVQGQSTYNPLSIYGIGEPELNEYGNTSGMGGVSIGFRGADFLNNTNPASLTALDTLTFMYNLSLAARLSSFQSGSQKEKTTNANIKKVSIGFLPARNWAISAGLQPFSAIGYKISSYQNIEGTSEAQVKIKYSGEGGLNKLYISNAVRILPGLSLGVNTYCILGSIDSREETEGWTMEKTSSTSKVSFDFGMQYNFKANKDFSLTLGAIYGLSTKLSFENTLKITDEFYNVLQEDNTKSLKQSLPMYYGLGASVNLNENLIIASDYLFQQWSTVESNYNNINFADVQRIKFGAEYCQSKNSYASFLKKIKYQAGFSIGNSYLQFIDNKKLNYGFTAGLSMPVRNSILANFSYEWGRAGLSSNYGQVKEYYNLLSFSVTIRDTWFLKRKYD